MASSAPSQAQPQAASLFETPVIVDTMLEAAEINRQLTAAILARQSEDQGVQVSNIGGWHSDTGMLGWGGVAAHKLLERIISAADHFTVDVGSDGKPRYRWFPEMWANVSPPGAANQFHTHPGSFWSAVYYIDDGYGGSADQSLGGELILLDPRMPGIAMNTPDLRFQRPGRPPQPFESVMRPASGRIVIFPSWLSHGVRPYRGKDLRISVAVNLSAIPLTIPTASSSDG